MNAEKIREKRPKPEQKFISFIEGDKEWEQVQIDMKDGWIITSLLKNGSYFVGRMERPLKKLPTGNVYLPPLKKLKIYPASS